MSIKKRLKTESLYLVLILIVTAICSHFLFEVEPWLSLIKHNVGYRPSSPFFPADTYTYWRFANQIPLKEVPFNVFGPALFGKLLVNNYYLIFAANFSLLYFSIYKLSECTKSSFPVLSLLLLSNPLISTQTYYINKEIYIICATIFLICFYYTKESSYLFQFFLIALFTKPEFFLISSLCLSVAFLTKNQLKGLTFLLITFISVFYSMIPGLESKVGVLLANISNKDSFSYSLYKLSNDYFLFAATIIPKSLNTILAGIIITLRDPAIISKTLPILISGMLYGILGLLNLKRIKRNGFEKEDYCFIFWAIAVSTIPFSVHRYLIPCYIFLAVKLTKTINPKRIRLKKELLKILPLRESIRS